MQSIYLSRVSPTRWRTSWASLLGLEVVRPRFHVPFVGNVSTPIASHAWSSTSMNIHDVVRVAGLVHPGNVGFVVEVDIDELVLDNVSVPVLCPASPCSVPTIGRFMTSLLLDSSTNWEAYSLQLLKP